jgi:hypothetical protein
MLREARHEIAYFAFGDILLTGLLVAACAELFNLNVALPRAVAAGAVAAGYR